MSLGIRFVTLHEKKRATVRGRQDCDVLKDLVTQRLDIEIVANVLDQLKDQLLLIKSLEFFT